MSRNRETRVFVGGLPPDASESELEKEFENCGPIKNVWVAKNPPGFAFIEFEEPRDAEQAVEELHDTKICGQRVRVELSRGRRGGGRGGRGGGYGSRECYSCGKIGHMAADCRSGGGRRDRSRSPYGGGGGGRRGGGYRDYDRDYDRGDRYNGHSGGGRDYDRRRRYDD